MNNENFNKAQEEMNKIPKKQQSKEEILKETDKVFKAINYKNPNRTNIIKRESNKNELKKSEDDIIYSREEFFYLVFPPEKEHDKRSLFEIYFLDLYIMLLIKLLIDI